MAHAAPVVNNFLEGAGLSNMGLGLVIFSKLGVEGGCSSLEISVLSFLL